MRKAIGLCVLLCLTGCASNSNAHSEKRLSCGHLEICHGNHHHHNSRHHHSGRGEQSETSQMNNEK